MDKKTVVLKPLTIEDVRNFYKQCELSKPKKYDQLELLSPKAREKFDELLLEMGKIKTKK